MANISFNEEQVAARTPLAARDPLLVRLVYKTGVVRTRRNAEILLIAIAILSLLLAFLFFPKGRGEPELDVPVAGPNSTRAR